MLEEHRTDNVVHHVDNHPRRVASPATGAPMTGHMPAAASARALESHRHTASPAQHGGQQYRLPVEDLLGQLQSQLHLHSNILEEQRHHIERIDGAVQRLQQEQTYIITAIRDVRTEMQSRPAAAPTDPDANEIDILTEQLQSVAQKVYEVEGLKLEINIMRRQLRRLERHASPAPNRLQSSEPMSHEHAHPPPAASGSHVQSTPGSLTAGTPSGPDQRSLLYQTPSDNRLPPPLMPNVEPRNDQHSSADNRTLPGIRSIDPGSSSLPGWRSAGTYPPAQPGLTPPVGAPTSTPQTEAPPVSGWAAVNAGSAPKRTMPVDGHSAPYDTVQPGSPKRQRLAPLMPRASYGEQNSTGASSPYQPSAATPDSLPQVPSLINSRNPSNESAGSLPPPPNPLRFVLATQEAPSEDSWRPDSQRPPAESSRGGSHGSPPRRGRGGGTRGRGRKSGGPDEHATPEWERPDWATGQIPPSGYYQPGMHTAQQHDHSRGGLVRRGGGHVGGPTDRPPQQQQQQHHPGGPGPVGPMGVVGGQDPQLPQSSLYPDPHFMPISTAADVASSSQTPGGSANQPTKKTRTKPIRNADGVLIRKDGRPDMRSVSSAMNLKKVHAKKEAERQSKEASTEEKDRGTPRAGNEHSTPSSPGARGERDGDEESDSDEDLDEHEEHRAREREETSMVGGSAQDRERHAQNMRKIFPYGIDGGPPGARNMAQAFFPPVGESRAPPEVKIEAAVGQGVDRDAAVPSRERSTQQDRAAVDGAAGPGSVLVSSSVSAPGPITGPANNGVVEDRRDVEMTEAGSAVEGP